MHEQLINGESNSMNKNTSIPTLTIIIPVYNGQKYIEATVQNIFRSSFQNLELLLIDDGSTDRSPEICDKCARLDARIRVFHKPNEGIAKTRNFGLDHASGDYIGFCDQDDEISADMYGIMLERIISDGSHAAICGCYRKKQHDKTVVYEEYTDALFEGEAVRDKLLYPMLFRGFDEHTNEEIRIYPTIWKCIISRQFARENRLMFKSFVNHEDDLIMLTLLLLKADKISTLSHIFYYWNTNVDSETFHFRGRYINDLEHRQMLFTDYMENLLIDHAVPTDIIRKYVYTLHCRNALEVLDNTALSHEKYAAKMRRLHHNQSIVSIRTSKDHVGPHKGFVRNRLIIPLLRKGHIIYAYFLNRVINYIRFFVEKHHVAEVLERRIKKA